MSCKDEVSQQLPRTYSSYMTAASSVEQLPVSSSSQLLSTVIPLCLYESDGFTYPSEWSRAVFLLL